MRFSKANAKKRGLLSKVLSISFIAATGMSLAACGGGSSDNGSATTTASASGGSATTAESTTAGTTVATTAASGSSSSGKDSLVIGTPNDTGGAINVHITKGYNMEIQNLVFESLVVNEPGKGIQPCLAESWDVSDDGKEYTFHLRSGIKFSDGEPLDAAAVKANFDAILDNKEALSWIASLENYDDCVVVDDSTVKIVLTAPYYPLLEELAMIRPFRMMSPKSFIDGKTKDGVQYYSGTGPYIWDESGFKEAQQSVIVANEDYWGGAPKIKTVTFKVMPSGQTTLQAFYNGEIDLLYGSFETNLIDADAIKEIEKDSKYQVKYSDPISTNFLCTSSHEGKLTADKNVRLAISYAINREEIASSLTSGIDQPAYTLFSKQTQYCDVDLEKHEYNVEKAKSLLEEAGYTMGSNGIYEKDGKSLTMNIAFKGSSATNKTTCEYIQSNLKDAGMELVLVPCEASDYSNIIKTGEHELCLSNTWGTEYDPHCTIAAFRKGNSYGASVDSQPFYDDLFSKFQSAVVETDMDKRKGYWSDFLTQMHDECVAIPTQSPSLVIIADSALKGITFGISQYGLEVQNYYFE